MKKAKKGEKTSERLGFERSNVRVRNGKKIYRGGLLSVLDCLRPQAMERGGKKGGGTGRIDVKSKTEPNR